MRRHADRLAHLHLKDVDGRVLARGLGYWDAVAAGAFCPLGDGQLDLEALARTLDEVGYAGFATIEQDRRAGTRGDPVSDLRRSVERLRDAAGARWATR
jgi:inosose dehydratase